MQKVQQPRAKERMQHLTGLLVHQAMYEKQGLTMVGGTARHAHTPMFQILTVAMKLPTLSLLIIGMIYVLIIYTIFYGYVCLMIYVLLKGA